jgi:hypothetical protein
MSLPGTAGIALALIASTGCGVGSVAPFVTDAEQIREPRLVGTWKDNRETAVITTADSLNFAVEYTDREGKVGRFHARAGTLGNYRVVDLRPDVPLPNANAAYESLLIRGHGLVVIDSVTDVLAFRILNADSVKSYLRRNPRAIKHTLIGDGVMITGTSDDTRRAFAQLIRRKNFLGEASVFRRDSASTLRSPP